MIQREINLGARLTPHNWHYILCVDNVLRNIRVPLEQELGERLQVAVKKWEAVFVQPTKVVFWFVHELSEHPEALFLVEEMPPHAIILGRTLCQGGHHTVVVRWPQAQQPDFGAMSMRAQLSC